MTIGAVALDPPFALAPMAGMTDTAFRRLVKRRGGCGLVVTEMVSSEGLVRGIDRTLEYAEYTEEERPVSIQIFGGDPEKMAAAAQIVEQMGADIVDVNMGCPVPKIAKHNAGCSLMRDPEHAARIVRAMERAVQIPVTVKMRAGWDGDDINAPHVAARRSMTSRMSSFSIVLSGTPSGMLKNTCTPSESACGKKSSFGASAHVSSTGASSNPAIHFVRNAGVFVRRTMPSVIRFQNPSSRSLTSSSPQK